MRCCIVISTLVAVAYSLPADIYMSNEEAPKYIEFLDQKDSCQAEWMKFKQSFSKHYGTDEEEAAHFEIFCEKLDIIRKHNELYEKGKSTFKMAVNKFTDMTPEEMKRYMGYSGRHLKVLNLSEDSCQAEWVKYREAFSKHYETNEEEAIHYNIFCAELDKIRKHNELYEKGETTFKMGVNKFTDMTPEEKQKYMGHLKQDCQTEWTNFKESFGKNYGTDEEEIQHYHIFCNKLNIIRKHNELYEKGESTFKMAVNKFTDMTPEEMKKYMGYRGRHFKVPNLGEDSCATEWAKYKKAFNKHYATDEEEATHFNIFCKELDKITKHNEQYDKGETTFKMGVNKFTDMTPEEKQKYMGHLKRDCKLEWAKFKESFGKDYGTDEEEVKHFLTFCGKLDIIRKHNELYDKGESTFKMAVNKFTDLTPEEMKKYMGYGRRDFKLASSLEDSCQTEWIKFKESFSKHYGTDEEEVIHFNIFCERLDEIKKHNEQNDKGESTYRMTVNRFTDMTPEEMKKYMGYGRRDFKLASSPEDTCETEWIKFKESFSKHYGTDEEEVKHFNGFCQKLDIIRKHNEQYEEGETTYKMAINKFTDLTPEEMEKYMGHRNNKKLTYLPEDDCRTEWTKFKESFKKSYESGVEAYRYGIFCEKLDQIIKHNEEYEKDLTTFKMGVNQFSDLTHEEFIELLKRGL